MSNFHLNLADVVVAVFQIDLLDGDYLFGLFMYALVDDTKAASSKFFQECILLRQLVTAGERHIGALFAGRRCSCRAGSAEGGRWRDVINRGGGRRSTGNAIRRIGPKAIQASIG